MDVCSDGYKVCVFGGNVAVGVTGMESWLQYYVTPGQRLGTTTISGLSLVKAL